MGYTAVSCGRRKKQLLFFVHSPVRQPFRLPDVGIMFSGDSTTEELKLLSSEGLLMVTKIIDLLEGKDDYVRCFTDRMEIVQPDYRWRASFSQIAAILTEWTAEVRLNLRVHESCPDDKKLWVQSLINSLK